MVVYAICDISLGHGFYYRAWKCTSFFFIRYSVNAWDILKDPDFVPFDLIIHHREFTRYKRGVRSRCSESQTNIPGTGNPMLIPLRHRPPAEECLHSSTYHISPLVHVIPRLLTRAMKLITKLINYGLNQLHVLINYK